MKSYDRLIALVVLMFAAGLVVANWSLTQSEDAKLYNIEANRLMDGEISITECKSITGAEVLDASADVAAFERFFEGGGYIIRSIISEDRITGYIKFTYINPDAGRGRFILWQNIVILFVFIVTMIVMLYIRKEIIRPMNAFQKLPEALARGDFTTPLKVRRGRYFGKFVWGLDMLRDTMLSQRQKTLELEKEKSQTALALSHDIKTPLSAIRLCAKALRDGLYQNKAKQDELLVKIDERADEIGMLLQKLQEGAEILDLPIEMGEFYLNDVVNRADEAYRWRFDLTGTEFAITPHSNALLKGDGDRVFESLCNLLENAMKYGDGKKITLDFDDEENCKLISVTNTGNTLRPEETVHMFDSFWRGSNSAGKQGSGLGLFIVRRLCVKMGGEAYAAAGDGEMRVVMVLRG
ncbi:hypothetical protein FACS1894217_03090 [Clostridia bacterium]|nr:hypothetical protein FACS1894217_03090 [Clostridia bacterium]